MKRNLSLAAPLVILIAWGSDTAYAALALQRGRCHARASRYRVRDHIALYGVPMRGAPLVDVAANRFVRRHVDYHCVWWLVPHSAVSPDRLAQAQTSLRQLWVADAAMDDQSLSSASTRRWGNCGTWRSDL